ncbi:alcohol dehydrogenase/L-iditol 2-dehydrogenase [Actinomadura hallensis]|uniref:Alcohol dehydrogenase/L-iditol 2-dehydrogenase n=1 Tax=Actinomadura hallensis TaxID=337895 RepID=A0A543I8K3_9ACTN|nr:alcohol dehydrogenase catalytic domain-containing protein [Actinomadura hallensis]TQM66926.1 alcohol dehydrogenase/L-iditol 2-dehydrogenase [Actinomadura hallensis]HLV74994.1 alcohol dehydrogenase catalytic domain-containing protein [Vulgatibacteraceae bacterium]
MRAIVLTGPRRTEVVDTWAEPEPGPGEVVVEMTAVGLCGSDLAVHDGTRPTPALPWVPGHEGGGRIVAVGPDVRDRRVGQLVAVEPNYCCFSCPPCARGMTSGCENRLSPGITVPGLLAERVAVPARFAWPLPEPVEAGVLACIEPLAVARSAVRRSGVRPGADCLVVGAGSQGLLTCLSLVEAGARAYVTDPHADRVAVAERIGARPVREGDGRAFPFVFDTAGVPAAWENATHKVATGGTVMVIGMSGEPVGLSTMELTRRQLQVRGSLIYDHPGDFADTVAAAAGAAAGLAGLLRPGVPVHEAERAFAEARTEPGKSWIDLSGWGEDQR